MIVIDEQAVPDRPAADLRTEVAGRAARFRRGRRVRLAASATTASVLAGLLFVMAVGGPTSDVRTTTAASMGGKGTTEVTAPPEVVRTIGEAVDPAVEALDDADDAMPPPTILPRRPDAPASTTPLTKAKAKVLFTRGEHLFEVMVDGTGERSVSGHKGWDARWSPDGGRLALTDDGSIVVIDLATDERTVVIEGTVTDYALYPAWMPDGRSVVYTRYQGLYETEQELWLVDVSTKATRRLRPNPDKPRVGPDRPVVRDDGTITYVCRAQGTAMLCMTDADGRDLGTVPGTRQVSHYGWSPDGRWLAFTAFNAAEGAMSSGLVIQRADGTDRKVLVAERVTSSPSWLPDGSRVVFSLNPPTADSLEEEHRWQTEGYGEDCPAWPCLSDTGIWSIRVDGSDPRPIVTGRYKLLLDARRA